MNVPSPDHQVSYSPKILNAVSALLYSDTDFTPIPLRC
jgi:hypothetical protein